MRARVALVLALAACHGGGAAASHKKVMPLSELPMAQWVGLPWSGGTLTVDLSDDLDHIKDWSKVTGTIDLDCAGCKLGDDTAKLSTGMHGDFGGDISFSHLTWDTATAHLDVKVGELNVISHWRGDLDLDFTMHGPLRPQIGSTPIDGCLALRPADRLKARDEKLYNLVLLMGAPKGPDGRFYIKLGGTLGASRRIPQICDVPAS